LRVFLDTSVLLPAFLGEHPDHVACFHLLLQSQPAHAFCAAHTLAELYSTLTRMPAPHRALPQQAILMIETAENHLTSVTLVADEYRQALREASSRCIAGGTVYDFLIAACALKIGADIIYTRNVKHFQQFGTELSAKIRTPETAQ
jgi:predicted nucleic acid-binding protein